MFMKVEMFGTQKSPMLLSFSNVDFLLIYTTDSAGREPIPFVNTVTKATSEND